MSESPVQGESGVTGEREVVRYEFTQSHRAYAHAWLREYYRAPRWGLVRGLGGPALVLLGVELRRLRPGDWLAAFGSFALGYGIYYALKPVLQVALLVLRRHRLGAHAKPTVVTVDAQGVAVCSGSAESRIGWPEIARAEVDRAELRLEIRGAHRAILPAPADRAGRDELERILRAHRHR